MIIESDNINDLYKKAIDITVTYGKESAPRGMPIKEIIAPQLVLTNPLNCLTTIKARKLNYRFAAIEKLEYLYGNHNPQRLIHYNPNMKNYVGKYNYFDGNYAQRFNFWLDHVYAILKEDRDSRQAVISIYDATARHQSSDIPCTLTLQFIIRSEVLHLIVNMRSNDLIWGFPYDINAFCFIQSVMAHWLGVKVGTYYHNVGSLHLYKNEHYQKLIDTLEDKEVNEYKNPVWDLGYEDTKKYLPLFFYAEQVLRDKNYARISYMPKCLLDYLDILIKK